MLELILKREHGSSIYPPGSKSEALQLGVQLNFLIFYQDLTLEYEDFFFILVVGGWWSATFGFFKSLDNNMVYTLGIYVYI